MKRIMNGIEDGREVDDGLNGMYEKCDHSSTPQVPQNKKRKTNKRTGFIHLRA